MWVRQRNFARACLAGRPILSEKNDKAYVVLSSGTQPVAGIVPRNHPKSDQISRWIAYVAVTDEAATLADGEGGWRRREGAGAQLPR